MEYHLFLGVGNLVHHPNLYGSLEAVLKDTAIEYKENELGMIIRGIGENSYFLQYQINNYEAWDLHNNPTFLLLIKRAKELLYKYLFEQHRKDFNIEFELYGVERDIIDIRIISEVNMKAYNFGLELFKEVAEVIEQPIDETSGIPLTQINELIHLNVTPHILVNFLEGRELLPLIQPAFKGFISRVIIGNFVMSYGVRGLPQTLSDISTGHFYEHLSINEDYLCVLLGQGLSEIIHADWVHGDIRRVIIDYIKGLMTSPMYAQYVMAHLMMLTQILAQFKMIDYSQILRVTFGFNTMIVFTRKPLCETQSLLS